MRIFHYLHLSCLIVISTLISCQQETKTTANTVDKKAIKEEQLQKEIIVEKILSEDELKTIIGTYSSNELFSVDYADNTLDGGSICALEIKKLKKGIVIKQKYKGDEPYGCSGPETNAEADFIKATKVADNIYKLFIKKTYCNYTDKIDCGMPDEEVDIKERNPKENAEVEIKIDFSF